MTKIKDFLLSKKNIVIISLIIILLIGIISFIAFNSKFFIKKKQNTNIIKERIIVNSGEEILTLNDYFINGTTLDNNTKITIDNITYFEKYYDKDNNEVAKDVAIDNESLLENYTIKQFYYSIGSYNVTIEDKINNKIYKTKLVVNDKTNPELLTNNLTINYGNVYNIDLFIYSCVDNSNETCVYNLLDENNNTITDLPTEIGEYKLFIKASDKNNNYTIAPVELSIVNNNTSNSELPKGIGSNIDLKKANNNSNQNSKVKISGPLKNSSGYHTNNDLANCVLKYVGTNIYMCNELIITCINETKTNEVKNVCTHDTEYTYTSKYYHPEIPGTDCKYTYAFDNSYTTNSTEELPDVDLSSHDGIITCHGNRDNRDILYLVNETSYIEYGYKYHDYRIEVQNGKVKSILEYPYYIDFNGNTITSYAFCPTYKERCDENETLLEIKYLDTEPISRENIKKVSRSGPVSVVEVNKNYWIKSETSKVLTKDDIICTYMEHSGIFDGRFLALFHKIPFEEAKPGDIIYYTDGGLGVDHVATYIGDGLAVHGNFGDNHETVIYYANMPWASEPIYMTLNDGFRKR